MEDGKSCSSFLVLLVIGLISMANGYYVTNVQDMKFTHPYDSKFASNGKLDCISRCNKLLPTMANYNKISEECECLLLNGTMTAAPGWTVLMRNQEWKWLLRVVTGSYVDVYNAWNTSGSQGDESLLTLDPTVSATYRSSFIDAHLDRCSKIKVSIYKNKSEVMYLEFNATGGTKEFFKHSKLLSTSYTDLINGSGVHLSMPGSTDSALKRQFIFMWFDGCPGDNGYLLVTGHVPGGSGGHCPIEKTGPPPLFLYSTKTTKDFYSAFGKGEVFGIKGFCWPV